mmetsp:Transcript_131896/g.333270  ORF Transcript_131896/g.333270 Transcript_131896/m.333270 type:complete len:200 (-) Transcript_131896:13-612(-)
MHVLPWGHGLPLGPWHIVTVVLSHGCKPAPSGPGSASLMPCAFNSPSPFPSSPSLLSSPAQSSSSSPSGNPSKSSLASTRQSKSGHNGAPLANLSPDSGPWRPLKWERRCKAFSAHSLLLPVAWHSSSTRPDTTSSISLVCGTSARTSEASTNNSNFATRRPERRPAIRGLVLRPIVSPLPRTAGSFLRSCGGKQQGET